MAVFMLYAMAVTTLIALACDLGERCCLTLGLATRAVWVAGVALIVGVSVVAVTGAGRVARPAGQISQADMPEISIVSQIEIPAQLATSRFESIAEFLRPLDTALVWLWALCSILFVISLGVLLLRARHVVVNGEKIVLSGASVRLTEDAGPALAGIFTYDIIIPRWVVDLPSAKHALIVAHEQQHARTHDPALIGLAAICTIMFPWNVPLWYMTRRLRTSIELDCDRRVLRGTGDLHAYASLLLEVGARMSSRPIVAAALSESASQIKRRIVAMSSYRSYAPRVRTVATAVTAAFVSIAAARIPSPEFPAFRPSPMKNVTAASDPRAVRASTRQSRRNTVRASVSSATPTAVLVYTTGFATIGVGSSRTNQKPDSLRLITPVEVNADITSGEVHIVRSSGRSIDVSAEFEGSPAIKATATGKHVVLMRGGTGVRTLSPIRKLSNAQAGGLPAGTYFEFQVDKPAEQRPGSVTPKYPADLRAAGVEGEVLAQFVVDARGIPDPTTYRLLKATNGTFATAVRAALPQMRYAPAERRRKKVSQLVQQSFHFRRDG